MPKQVLKIDRFEGGLNTQFEERDIPDNSVVRADNVMFDKVGRVRPAGYVENLSTELGLTDVNADSAPGYGLFSFSHDFTNPDVTTEMVENTAFSGTDTMTTDTSIDIYTPSLAASGYHLANGTDYWYFHNFVAGGADVNRGWFLVHGSDLMSCDLTDDPSGYDSQELLLYQKIGSPGRAYRVTVEGDFDSSEAAISFLFMGMTVEVFLQIMESI